MRVPLLDVARSLPAFRGDTSARCFVAAFYRPSAHAVGTLGRKGRLMPSNVLGLLSGRQDHVRERARRAQCAALTLDRSWVLNATLLPAAV